MQLSDVIGNDTLFPVRKKWRYFNHAGVSPMNTRGGDVLKHWVDAWQDDCIMGGDWFGKIPELCGTTGRLINGDPMQVALLKNTAEGISTVAFGLDWQRGDRIVINQSEYPANQYPWLALEERFGVEVVKVPEVANDDGSNRHVPTEAILAALDDDRVKLCSVSHVQWSTGQRMDLPAIGGVCRKRGILFGVDAIQSLGVMPVDVEAAQCDFLWAGCHKWQLGPMGVGVFWCRREVMDRVRPLSLGAFSVKDPFDWGTIDLTFENDARRYACGTPNLSGFLVLLENHKLLHEIGIEPIYEHVTQLGDQFAAALRDTQWVRVSPPAARSQILTFTHPEADLDALLVKLREEHHVELAVRSGRLRFSPHLHNTAQEVDQVAAILRDV
ncbi:MAG: aminotransferase class V-fold PLP-dependent enzyme [Planctomycetota bacterium]